MKSFHEYVAHNIDSDLCKLLRAYVMGTVIFYYVNFINEKHTRPGDDGT